MYLPNLGYNAKFSILQIGTEYTIFIKTFTSSLIECHFSLCKRVMHFVQIILRRRKERERRCEWGVRNVWGRSPLIREIHEVYEE